MSLSQMRSKDLDEGHVDPNFKPHPIPPNTLHNANSMNRDSVAGPEVTDEHMSESVHRSSMEGGEPFPEQRRDLVTPGHNPSFDPATQPSTNPASSGDAAEASNAAKGAKLSAELNKKAAEAAET
jgi:hypothetical protein